MAHVFKYPTASNKGVVVFTHKEMQFFFPNHAFFNPVGKKESLKRLVGLGSASRANNAKAERMLESLGKNYFIGVHFGWEQHNFPDFGVLDFCLGSSSGVTIDSDRMSFIPLNSRNFISDHFFLDEPKLHTKLWDVLMVSRDAKFKNIDLFLKAIRRIYDSGQKPSVLLLIPSHPRRDKDSNFTYTELMEDYQRLFDYKDRESFSILKLHTDMPVLGMTHAQLAKFYHLSKTFALFSEVEGGSKVISEALLSGLTVIAKSDLKGGGLDYLTPENSVLFDEFESSEKAILKALELYDTRQFDKTIQDRVGEKRSIEQLKSHFEKLYQTHGQTFDGKLDQVDYLSLRLPGIWSDDLPWAKSDFATSDILSDKQLDRFVEALKIT